MPVTEVFGFFLSDLLPSAIHNDVTKFEREKERVTGTSQCEMTKREE